jgi:hypothetical protein
MQLKRTGNYCPRSWLNSTDICEETEREIWEIYKEKGLISRSWLNRKTKENGIIWV